MNDVSMIILAAGKGKRMKNVNCKVLAEIMFKPMINWVVDVCKNFGCPNDNICIVCPKDNHDIVKQTNNLFNYVIQDIPLGTAHAVAKAINFIKNTVSDHIIILLGDSPLISSDILFDLYNYHISKDNSLTILSSDVKNPFGYGRIVRNADDHDTVLKISEEVDCSFDEKRISEINSGVLCFKKSDLLFVLDKINNNNSQSEFYITSAVSILNNYNLKVGAFNCYDESIVLGANTNSQLIHLNEVARLKIIYQLADLGVKFISTDGVIITPDVQIGAGTVIYPNVVLKGNCTIGDNCIITSNSYIQNSYIGDNCIIKSSYIDLSKISDNVKIGPFSNIRPNSDIHDDVKIGDFVEIKNSIIGSKTSVAHLTYIGDSYIGKNVNFGCGCVTVNYNGKKKFKTVIGDNCFIGCNTNLVAPVTLGNNVYIAAGSTITEDLPQNSLGIARSKQVIKQNWHLKD